MRKGDRVKYSYSLYSNVSGKFYHRWKFGLFLRYTKSGEKCLIQIDGNKGPSTVDPDWLTVTKAFDPTAKNQISMFNK